MPTFVYRNGKLVDKNLAPPKHASGRAHYVISDEMAATRHMADGKYYTSKKKFRDATRAAGCIEIGDQSHYLTKPRKPATLDRIKRRDDIRRAIYELKNR